MVILKVYFKIDQVMKVNLGNDREIAAVCMRQIEGGNATGLKQHPVICLLLYRFVDFLLLPGFCTVGVGCVIFLI